MLNHIGLQYSSKSDAERFYTNILGLSKEREFTVPAELAEAVFGVNREIEVEVFGDDRLKFEVFYTDEPIQYIYEHIGLIVPSKAEFIERCKSNGIEPITAKKGDKELLFVRDFAGHLYELKEE